MATSPWDRVPSDLFLPVDGSFGFVVPIVLLLQIPFALSFLAAWPFHFPTTFERWMWRVCALYHVMMTIFMTGYFILGTHQATKQKVQSLIDKAGKPAEAASQASVKKCSNSQDPERSVQEQHQIGVGDIESASANSDSTRIPTMKDRLRRVASGWEAWLETWRNLSPDEDPDMKISIRWIIPTWVMALLYILSRLAFYVEDAISLRQQPAGVYMTVNRFVPFI